MFFGVYFKQNTHRLTQMYFQVGEGINENILYYEGA